MNLTTIPKVEWTAVPGKYVAEFNVGADYRVHTYHASWVASETADTVLHGVLFKLGDAPQHAKRILLDHTVAELRVQKTLLLAGPLWALRSFALPVQVQRGSLIELDLTQYVLAQEPVTLKLFIVATESREPGVVPHVRVFKDADEELALRGMLWRYEL